MSDKNYERTSADQLSHYLAFLEQHPELQANKMDPRNAHKIDELWAKLANELNALKGPVRDPSKWKHSLARWKRQLHPRAHEFEERALQTFGTAAVEGVPSIPTLGVESETIVLEEDNSIGMEEEFLDDESYEQSSYSSLDMSSSPRESRTRKRRGTTENVYTKIIKILEDKNEQDRKAWECRQKAEERQQQLQQQIVEKQRMMAEALRCLGEGLNAFSKVAEIIINKKE